MLTDDRAADNSDNSLRCTALASALLNIWTPSTATIWVANGDAWKLFQAGSFQEFSQRDTHAANDRLLELACEREGILWIEPSANHSFWRAIGRVGQAAEAVLDLVYDSSSGPLPLPRDVILLGLEHNANLLARFGDSLWRSSGAFSEISRYIDSIAMESMQQRRLVCERIGEQLQKLEGQKFESLEENQKLAAAIHRLLEENGLRLQCPNCGEPAILRCLKAGNSPAGSFLFDHRVNGRRTMHGGRGGLPSMIVVDKTPRANIREPNLKVMRFVNGIQVAPKTDTVA